MAVSWTLTLAGVLKPLASWGITDAQLSFRSLDADELTFSIAGDVFADCPFAYGQAVVLQRDAVTWFSGTVSLVDAGGGGRMADWRVTVAGPWRQLQRTTYQQPTASYSAECAALGDVKTTKVVLFQDALTGAAISTGQQISAAITYALTQGVVLAPGTAPAWLTVPFETTRDLKVSAVILRCLEFTPDAVGWIDYTTGVPTLNCQQRDALAAVALDFAAERPAPRIESFSLRERSDLVPAGVRFNYVGIGSCPLPVPPGCVDATTGILNSGEAAIDGDSASQGMKITQDSAGLPDGPGGVIGTIDLAQLDGDTTEAAPVGLAAQYYARLLTPQWQGNITVREQECSGVARPGQVLNLANGNPRWATMRAVVQEVRESLKAGETHITVGPAEHLGPQDFAALSRITQRRGLVQDAFAAVRAPGTAEVPNCHAGKDPKAKQVLDKLKGNGAAAAQAIGAENLAGVIVSGATAPGGGGALGTAELELCDPVGATITVLVPAGGAPTP